MEKSKQLERGSLYTVGWIAALSIELTAAIQMLDEQHDPPADYISRPVDPNVYVWGRVGDHNVIIAFIEAGAYGIVPAATTAANLFRSFPGIRMCLLVGIGAGIRRRDFDVRLGDVVISQPDGKSGGVYQYDLQKARFEGQIENIGILNRPSTLLLKILTRVQAHHAAHPSRVPEYAKRITREMAPPFNEPGYVHQGLENDRLFKSTFSHVPESAADDLEDFDFDDSSTGEPNMTCPNCPQEGEVKRRERASGTNPQFHYGTIASGNTLVKDADTRNKIVARVPGDCICFEMEAAGMMNNFSCLVIRGICDYADSHKNDRWQPYAALTAAAYAREFLQFAPRGDVEMEQPLVEQLEDIARTMHGIQTTTAETNATLQVGEVEKWLSPFDPSDNYNIAICRRNEGVRDSGRWFLESPEFLEWKNTRNSFLWLYGLAGCGKTVLCSTAIEHLKSEADCVVLFFYFAFNDSRTRSKGSLVRSLIMQLSRYDERAMKTLIEQRRSGQPSDEELGNIFVSMVTNCKQVTIVLDGVDELERKENKRRDVLLWIKEIVRIDTADVRVLASSRNERDIATELESINLAFQLTPAAIEEDIKAFVHKQIHDESSCLRRWRNRPDVQAMVERTLAEKADGMFRWVVCQMEALQNCLNLKTLREQLSSLPKSLDETYDRIVQDLWGTQQREAIKLLQFLSFTERPLGLLEAIDLIAVDVTETPSFHPDNRMPEPLEIVEVCSSLVMLDVQNPNGKVLQLAHFSVKEYLVSGRMRPDLLEHFKEIPAHASIVNTCLGYLESVFPSVKSIWKYDPEDLETSTQSEEETTWEDDLSKFPLMEYAIRTWPIHAKHCQQHTEIATHIQKFFQKNVYFTEWLFCFCAARVPADLEEHEFPEAFCPILISIYLDLPGIALEMIDKGLSLNAEYISEELVPWLEPNRYTLNPRCGLGYDAEDRGYVMTSHLCMAIEKGMKDVVEALINRGVDIHEEGSFFGTALDVACCYDSTEIVSTLLQRSRDCSSQESFEMYVQGAFRGMINHYCDRLDLEDMIPPRDQLVEACLILDNPGSVLDHCLKTVFIDFNLDLARRLVRKGARVNLIARLNARDIFRDEKFLLSFLHLFTGEESGNVDPDALKTLFAREPQRPGPSCRMLHQAIERGFNEVLCFMMAHGVDREFYVPPNGVWKDSECCTALFMALERRNTVAVQTLFSIHKDSFGDYTPTPDYINEKNGMFKQTCLHLTAQQNDIEVMKALISHKADLEAKAYQSRTPLHEACRLNCFEAVKLLVESGANLQALDSDEETPLQYAQNNEKYNPVSSKAIVEWLEQWSSHDSSSDGLRPKRENEAENDDSFTTERYPKRQKIR